MKEEGIPVYHLAFGQSPFPIPTCFVEALKRNADSHEYLPVSGIYEYMLSKININITIINLSSQMLHNFS